jgi:hypothetical protein
MIELGVPAGDLGYEPVDRNFTHMGIRGWRSTRQLGGGHLS